MNPPNWTDEERQQILADIREAWEALQAELATFPPDELDRIRDEVTEAVDERIRQEAIQLQKRAS